MLLQYFVVYVCQNVWKYVGSSRSYDSNKKFFRPLCMTEFIIIINCTTTSESDNWIMLDFCITYYYKCNVFFSDNFMYIILKQIAIMPCNSSRKKSPFSMQKSSFLFSFWAFSSFPDILCQNPQMFRDCRCWEFCKYCPSLLRLFTPRLTDSAAHAYMAWSTSVGLSTYPGAAVAAAAAAAHAIYR